MLEPFSVYAYTMSLKGKPMDPWFQRYNIIRVNRLRNFDSDEGYPLSDLLDFRLHLDENIERIIEHFRSFSRNF